MSTLQLEYPKKSLAEEMILWVLNNSSLGDGHVASDFISDWEHAESGETLILRLPQEHAAIRFSKEAIAETLITSWLNQATVGERYVPSDFIVSWEQTESGESLLLRLRDDVLQLVCARRRAQKEAENIARELDHAPGSEPPGCDEPGTSEDPPSFFR